MNFYLVDEKLKKKNKCNDCQAEISNSSTRCMSCHKTYLNSNKFKGPSKEQLIKDIEFFNGNKSAIARKYCVSDKSVAKWINKYELRSFGGIGRRTALIGGGK